jgi:hypothetical protein
MAAGQGFKTFVTGEVLTAGDVNGYLMQGINVFATTTARDAAITAPAEGQFAFTKDTNSLWYYDGAAWVASGATGDIEGVTAGIGISGGGTSGTVTVTNSMATAIDAKGDLVPGTGADTFARLAVGANNTVLTADSAAATGMKWATTSPALTWSLLNAGGTALTGAASVTVSGISNKTNLMVIISNGSSTNTTANVKIRINSDSGTNYNAWGNQTAGTASYAATNLSGFSSTSGTGIQLCDLSNNASSSCTAYLRLDGCTSADLVAFWGAGGTNPGGGNGHFNYTFGGYYDGNAAVTSITANVDSGTWDAGTMFIYGA